MEPLDKLRDVAKAGRPKRLSISEMAKDILQDDGLALHRKIFRDNLSSASFPTDQLLAELVSGYRVIRFGSAVDYELEPKELPGLRIRCRGPEVLVIETNSQAKESVLVKATVQSET